MLSADRDALACDMAETYHILDIKELPVETLAVLASGLRADSRIMMKLMGLKDVPDKLAMAHIADTLTRIYAVLAGQKKLPTSFSDVLFGRTKKKENKGFATAKAFEAARARIIGGLHG